MCRRLAVSISLATWLQTGAYARKRLTWEDAKLLFKSSNPNLRAGQIATGSRAQELTAFLRPNSDLTVVHGQSLSAIGEHFAASIGQLPA